MSRLYLLRHSKAGWALPGVRDFDRPLDASGLADAERLGLAMRAAAHVPDLTLCSNARRARETLAYGFPTSGLAVVRFDDGLGEAAPRTGYLEAFLTPTTM